MTLGKTKSNLFYTQGENQAHSAWMAYIASGENKERTNYKMSIAEYETLCYLSLYLAHNQPGI